jgi:hypothetical protein
MSSYLSLTVQTPRLPFVRSPKQLLTLRKESVEDEDEVLTALSDELGGFVEYVGGPEYAHVLLSPLENLAAIEELLVRDKVSFPDNTLRATLTDRFTGCRVTQQDLRTTINRTDRSVLHPSHRQTLKSRLVHRKDFVDRCLQSRIHQDRPPDTRVLETRIRTARP